MSKTRKIFLFLGVPLIIIFAVVAFIALRSNKVTSPDSGRSSSSTASANLDPWGEPCKIKETGRKELTTSPMNIKDIETVAPMGLTAGGHVTPIDHMYFYPMPTPGDRFSAKVYAAADGVITGIQHRGDLVSGPADAKPGTDEFRLTIEQTCNQGYYYDLITKLEDSLQKKVGTLKGGDSKGVQIPVTAGQLIGYVGNQSLDFGVYDTNVTLGFIVPEHYQAEPWKIHTADAFTYFTADALNSFMPKVLRFAEPRSGKIDYDKDGYLIGNWFEKGTNGYGGKDGHPGANYWEGHLALLYDAYDPTMITISIGTFKGNDPQAFAVVGNQPDPGTINQESGLVKYELTSSTNYLTPNGAYWDHKTPTAGLKGQPGTQVAGVILFQLMEPRLLKVEVFPGKTASEVTSFTESAKLYER